MPTRFFRDTRRNQGPGNDTEARLLCFPGAIRDSDHECRLVIETLPWFLNGTLDAEETRTVNRHLVVCAACRRELRQAADVWQLVTDHPDSLELAQYVEGPEDLGEDSRLEIERHLAHCSECSGLVSPDAIAPAALVVSSVQHRPAGRWLPMAASFAVAVLLGTLMLVYAGLESVPAGPSSAVVDSFPVPPLRMAEAPGLAKIDWESGLDQLDFEQGPAVATPSRGVQISVLDFESGELATSTSRSAM